MSAPHGITFTLPWPPSVNGYWRAINRGSHAAQIISERGRAFRSAVVLRFKLCPQRVHFAGRVALEITLHCDTRRRYDLDNHAKGICDALTHAGVWDDDSQVDELRLVRGAVDPGNPRAVVTIRSLS